MEGKPKSKRGRPRTIVNSAQRKKERDEQYRLAHREELRLKGRERKRVTVSEDTMEKLLELQTKLSLNSPNEVINLLIQVFEENERCSSLKQQSFQKESVKRMIPQLKTEQIVPRKRRGRPPKNRPVELDLRTSTIPTTIRMSRVKALIPVYPAVTMTTMNNKTIKFVQAPSVAPTVTKLGTGGAGVNDISNVPIPGLTNTDMNSAWAHLPDNTMNVATTQLIYSNSNNTIPCVSNSISSVVNAGLMNSSLHVANNSATNVSIVGRAVVNDGVDDVAKRIQSDASGGAVMNSVQDNEPLEDDTSTMSPAVLSARLAFSRALQNSYKALISQDPQDSSAMDNDSSIQEVSQGPESDFVYTVEDYPSSANENDASAYIDDSYETAANFVSLHDDSSFQEEMEGQGMEDLPSGELVEHHQNLSEVEDYPGQSLQRTAIDSSKTESSSDSELKEWEQSEQSIASCESKGPSLEIGKRKVPDPKRRSRLDQIAGGLLNKLKRKADGESADS